PARRRAPLALRDDADAGRGQILAEAIALRRARPARPFDRLPARGAFALDGRATRGSNDGFQNVAHHVVALRSASSARAALPESRLSAAARSPSSSDGTFPAISRPAAALNSTMSR